MSDMLRADSLVVHFGVKKRYVRDQMRMKMSPTATEDVRTLRRLFACVACKQEAKAEQTHGTKDKHFSWDT